MNRIILAIGVWASLSSALYAAPKASGENWSLIDFKQITLPDEEGGLPAVYTITHETDMMVQIPMRFCGELVKTHDIDLSDKKKAVRLALEEKGWNFALLSKYIGTVEKYKAVDYSTDQFYEDIKTITGINGYITDAVDLVTGYKNRNEYFKYETYKKRTRQNSMDYLLGKGLDLIGKANGIPFLGELTNASGRFDVFNRARQRDAQKWTNRVADANRKAIEEFYELARRHLLSIAQQKESIWVLRIHGSANSPFYYDNVLCTQHWSVSMELTKNSFGDNEKMSQEEFTGTYAGEYIGWMEAEVVYSMANWDAQYFVDEEIKKASQTQNAAEIATFMKTDARFTQSYMKIMAERLGIPFKHETKPTQAHNVFRLPVSVRVPAPDTQMKALSPSLYIFNGDKEWMPGDKPQPEITKTFQLVHNVSVKGKTEGGQVDYMENYYATEDELIHEHHDVMVLADENLGAVGALSSTNGKTERTSSPLNPDGFNGKPDGSLTIFLDQSSGPKRK